MPIAIMVVLLLVGVIGFFAQSYSLEYVVSKTLGWTIVMGSTCMKVPQIVKIWNSKSSEGLAVSMYYIEVSLFLFLLLSYITFLYHTDDYS